MTNSIIRLRMFSRGFSMHKLTTPNAHIISLPLNTYYVLFVLCWNFVLNWLRFQCRFQTVCIYLSPKESFYNSFPLNQFPHPSYTSACSLKNDLVIKNSFVRSKKYWFENLTRFISLFCYNMRICIRDEKEKIPLMLCFIPTKGCNE